MKKRVLFVQGAGAGAHEADARLVASLIKELGPDYEVRYPRTPDEASPDDALWEDQLVSELARMGDSAILVGHSAGALRLVRLLAERGIDRRVDGVLLIATPFCGDGGWHIEGCELPADLRHRLPGEVPVFLYHGHDDEIVPFAHLDLYAKAIPQAVVRRLPDRNHQLNDDLSEVAADIKRLRSSPASHEDRSTTTAPSPLPTSSARIGRPP
jgi:predicted alpha/beta hydrolase family esterase